jgi:two-component system, chemotaxis family, chemotaxis protein CheY
MPRVFLCDDESHYRSLVRAVLSAQDEPYEVVGEASDGREAIELAPALAPDIILLDINMPGMGGVEALPQLRELLPDARILALTTAWAASLEQQFRDAGGDGFIEKPRNAMTLPAKLGAALGQAPVEPLDVAELMFHTWWSDEPAQMWDLFAPDVEYRPLLTGETLRGLDAMRGYLESLPREQQRTARVTRMVAYQDVVVVEGTADMPNGDGRERSSVSWTVRVTDGKVTHIRGFRGWDEAHRQSGLPGGLPPTEEREFSRGHGWLLSAGRRLLGAPAPGAALA